MREKLFKIDENSTLFSNITPDIIDYIKNTNSQYFNHKNGITPEHFQKYKKLTSLFSISSQSNTSNGTTIVSSIEGKGFPFYGTQFHPEKNGYIWLKRINVDHHPNSISFAQQISNFFVNQARNNFHSFNSEKEKNYCLKRSQPEKVCRFMKCFFYGKVQNKRNTTIIN